MSGTDTCTYNYKFTSEGEFVFEETGKDYIGNAKIKIKGTYEYLEKTGIYLLYPERFWRNSESTGNIAGYAKFYGMVSGGKLYFNSFLLSGSGGSRVYLHTVPWEHFLYPESSPAIEEGDWYYGYFSADYDTEVVAGFTLAFKGINSVVFKETKTYSFSSSDKKCKFYQGSTEITYSYELSDNKLELTKGSETETYDIIMHTFDFSNIKNGDSEFFSLLLDGKVFDVLILQPKNYLTKVK